MNIYNVSWFDGLNWKWMKRIFLAESENQIKQYMDKYHHYRMTETRTKENNYIVKNEDSLKIELEEEDIKLPYILYSYATSL